MSQVSTLALLLHLLIQSWI